MEQGLSDHYVVLCKFRLVGAWIKRREKMVGARRIRREKPREHQYREGYAKSLEGKDIEHMWEQAKLPMAETAGEVCGSVRVGGKNPKSVCWNDWEKAAVRRKKAAWKELLAVSDEAKERCMEKYREGKRKVKRSIYHSKKKVNENWKERNEDVNGNRKLFWEEEIFGNGVKAENSSRMKDGNGRLVQVEDEVRRIWKENRL